MEMANAKIIALVITWKMAQLYSYKMHFKREIKKKKCSSWLKIKNENHVGWVILALLKTELQEKHIDPAKDQFKGL